MLPQHANGNKTIIGRKRIPYKLVTYGLVGDGLDCLPRVWEEYPPQKSCQKSEEINKSLLWISTRAYR